MLLWQFQTFTSWTRNPTRFSPKISKIAFSKWMSIVFYIDKFLFLKLAILGNLAVLAIFWRSWLFSAIWQFSSFQSWQHCTMLQKLSKCKVKAWLCWNLMILLLLRFCVKSHFGEFKWSKNVIYNYFRGSEFWF